MAHDGLVGVECVTSALRGRRLLRRRSLLGLGGADCATLSPSFLLGAVGASARESVEHSYLLPLVVLTLLTEETLQESTCEHLYIMVRLLQRM